MKMRLRADPPRLWCCAPAGLPARLALTALQAYTWVGGAPLLDDALMFRAAQNIVIAGRGWAL